MTTTMVVMAVVGEKYVPFYSMCVEKCGVWATKPHDETKNEENVGLLWYEFGM